MTDIMTLNYLFFLGIVIPCIVTIVLFVVFLVCWNKHRIQKEIMTKKYDPHQRSRASSRGSSVAGSDTYRVPRPPLPPKWIYGSSQSQDNQHILPRDNKAFEESPNTPSASVQNRQMYNTFHDSGMCDLSDIQYRFEQHRPNSQASTDSEDSGFRSSRSGQYLHSAQNSNAQEVPLFKPISSNNDSLSQTVNIPSNEKTRNPSRHSRHKSKSPNNIKTKLECSAVNKKSHLSVISAPAQPLTFTTATVHQPNLEDHGSHMAYSVV